MPLLSIAITVGLCGCSTVSSIKSIASTGIWNDTVETLRNRSYSAKAWHRRKHNFANCRHNRDFQAGFRAGYEAIADGKPGCPPTFPPKEYWGWEFQSADGQSRIAAWFEGYPHGVQAAREDGVTSWNHFASSSQMGGGQCSTGACGPTNMSLGDVYGQPMEISGEYAYPMGTSQFPMSDTSQPSVTIPTPELGTPTPFPTN